MWLALLRGMIAIQRQKVFKIDWKTDLWRLARHINCSREMRGHGSYPTLPLEHSHSCQPLQAFMVERRFRSDGAKGTRERCSWPLETWTPCRYVRRAGRLWRGANRVVGRSTAAETQGWMASLRTGVIFKLWCAKIRSVETEIGGRTCLVSSMFGRDWLQL